MSFTELEPGSVLLKSYRIVRRIGHGGMGEVYEATHERLAGRYAIKILNANLAAWPEALERFRREALVTSSLQHPGIIHVIDFDQTPEGAPFLVMEFLDGRDLSQIIRDEAPLALPRAASLVGQVASAVGAAHRKGVVHRDLKPQNIFVVPLGGDDEMTKVIDFGISKVQALPQQLTQDRVLGTPLYLSPEQATGRNSEVDARTDQFALAAVTYELLSGKPPFIAENIASLVHQIVNAEPEPLAALNVAVSGDVEQVVRRGLAKAASERYSSIEEFAKALNQALLSQTPRLGQTELVQPLPSPTRSRSGRRVIGIFAAAAALAAFAAVIGRPRGTAPARSPSVSLEPVPPSVVVVPSITPAEAVTGTSVAPLPAASGLILGSARAPAALATSARAPARSAPQLTPPRDRLIREEDLEH